MKKRFLLTAIIIFLFGFPFQLLAQKQLSFNLKGQMLIDEDLKSVSQARGIAFTNTLLPIATGVAAVALFDNNTVQSIGVITTVYGLVMGPSTGNFYANDYGRGFAGLAARAAGVYLMADATREIFGDEFANALGIDDKKVSLTDTKILIGELLVLGSTLYNIISAKASVDEYNSKQRVTVNISSAQVSNQQVPLLTATVNF
ncbi:MAG TPA: hypothetical protein VF181_01845 [Balneolaceae bacterium]